MKDCTLFIKPNPKSKYELSNNLIKLTNEYPNVKFLSHEVKMSEVIKGIDLVVTVTGTIAIERILLDKPVITLIRTMNNDNSNCIFIENLSEIPKIIDLIKANVFPKISLEDKIDFMNQLMSTSYKGIISDPFINLHSVSQENINSLVFALKDVLNAQI